MLEVITLCNDDKWIPNIKSNIERSPEYVHWNIFLNNCSTAVADKVSKLYSDKCSIFHLGHTGSFSAYRAEAFSTIANATRCKWIMNVDADDKIEFSNKLKELLAISTADVIINPEYILKYPDKEVKVETSVPLSLAKYVESKDFLYTVQFIYNSSMVSLVYVPTDTNVSSYDEIIPQIRLYEHARHIEVCSGCYTYYYTRGHETISNNKNYYLMLLNLAEVYRKAAKLLNKNLRLKLLNRMKTLNLDYILRKAGDEADNIKLLFDKITTEVENECKSN